MIKDGREGGAMWCMEGFIGGREGGGRYLAPNHTTQPHGHIHHSPKLPSPSSMIAMHSPCDRTHTIQIAREMHGQQGWEDGSISAGSCTTVRTIPHHRGSGIASAIAAAAAA